MGKTPNGKLTKALKDLVYAGFVAKDSGINISTGEYFIFLDGDDAFISSLKYDIITVCQIKQILQLYPKNLAQNSLSCLSSARVLSLFYMPMTNLSPPGTA